ncbi:MAG: CDP-alcohol phosphatidyltransferase family protein [Oscillospiraceae bacterium]|nr:CDP-alcohol phosphatidyltransferase family protein [Oscillospiraceae bacterium]
MLPKLTKKEIFSIPNLFTYLRIALIPVFIDFYYDEDFGAAFAVLVLSFLSDGADGFIARRFNMITDLGKALDPIADKLSQAAIVFCAGKTAPIMFVLLGVHIAKELAMLILSCYLYKQTGRVYGARWYGKWCTVLIYCASAVLLLWRDMPAAVAAALAVSCIAFVLFCFVKYALLYRRMLQAYRQSGAKAAQQEFDRVRER